MTSIKVSSLFSVGIRFIAIYAIVLLSFSACATREANAKKALEEHLKNQGVTDLQIDFFYTNPNFPDKAYAGITVTYNFASSGGKPQREYAGYILKKEGDGWKVENNTFYTKDESKALTFLAGKKS